MGTTNDFASASTEAMQTVPGRSSEAGDSSAVAAGGTLRNGRFDGSLALLGAVIGKMGESVVITDAYATIQFVNPAFTRITGYSAEEVLGQNARLLKSGREDPARYRELSKTIFSGEVWRGELINQRKNGPSYIGEMSITPVRDSSGANTNFIAIQQDVTERRATDNVDTMAEVLPVEVTASYLELDGRDSSFPFSRDVTEPGGAKKALEESEQSYRLLFDEMVTGCALLEIIYDENGKPCDYLNLDVNPAFEAQTGISRDRIAGKRILEVFPDIERFWIETYGKVALTGESTHFENCAAPLEKWFEVTAFRTGSGCVAVTFTDTTERKRAERDLRLTQFSMEHASYAVHWSDSQGRIVYVNEATCRALERSREELLGSSIPDIDPLFSAERWTTFWKELKTHGSMSFETEHRTPEGRAFPVEVTANYLDYDGKEYSFAFSRDITERRRAEEALRASESRYRLLFETSVAATTCNTFDGRIVDCNNNAAQIMGYGSPQEVVGLNIQDIYWDREKREGLIARLKAEKTAIGVELKLRHKNGNPIWLIVNFMTTPPDKTGEVLVQATFVDIGGRKRLEEQLRLTQHSVDHASDSVQWLDPEGRFVYVNEAACRSLGYSREELLRMSIADVDPIASERGWKPAWEALRLSGSATFETQQRTKEGRTFPVEVNANHLEFDGKEYSFAYARDITERKRGEEQLRKLSVAVEQSPVSVVITNAQGTIEYVNLRFTQLTGYTLEEAIGQNSRILKSGKQPAAYYRELWDTIIAGGEWHGEFANKKKNGEIYWEAAAIVPIRDSCGIITHFLAVKEDITDRKRTEEALRDSEHRYRQLFERNLAGVFRTVLDGRILECNQACARMFGYNSHEEVVNLPVSSLYTTSSEREAVLTRLKAEKSFTNNEVRYRRKDGSVFWAITSMNLTYSDSGDGIIDGALVDITARKHAEEELYQSRQMLQCVLDNIPQRVFWKDRNSIYLGCNRAFAKDAGLNDPAEIIGKTDFDLWNGAGEQYRADDSLVMEKGIPKLNFDESRSGPDGGPFWLLTNKLPLRDAEGNVTGVLGTYEDISERRQAEQALAQAEEKYRSLVLNLPDVVWTVDASGRYAFISPNVEKISGYTVSELEQCGARLFLEIVHPDDLGAVQAALEALYSRNEAFDVECRIRRKNGEWIWVHDRSLTTYEKNGVRYADGILSEITGRKRAEEALRDSQHFLQSTLDALSSHVAIVNENGEIVAVNASWQRFAAANGGTPQTCNFGSNYLEVCKSASQKTGEPDLAGDGIRRVLAKEVGEFSLEYPCHSPEQKRWFVMRATRFGGDGAPRAVLAHENITNRKLAEEAVHESEERFRIMADGCPALMWVTGTDGNNQFINRAYREFCGKDLQYLQADRWQLLVHPDDAAEYVAAFQRAVGDHTSFTAEARIRRTDGEWRWVASHAEPRFSPTGEYMGHVGLSPDITERKQTEQSLQFQNSLIRAIHEVSLDGILVVTDDGFIASHNQRFKEVWQFPLLDMADNMPDYFIGDQPPPVLSAVLERVKDPVGFVKRVRELNDDPDGSDHCEIELRDGRTVERYSSSVRSETGKHLGRVWFFRDITERKHTEQALQSSEEKFRQLAENVREVFWMMPPTADKILYVSPAYEHVWGRSVESLYQNPMSWTEPIHPDDLERAHAMFGRQMQGEAVESEYRIRTPQGQEKWIRDRAFPVRDHAGQLARIVGVAEDITERKEAEKALRESEEGLAAAQRIAHIGSWYWNVRTDTSRWSDETFRIFGLTPDHLGNHREAFLELIDPADRLRVNRALSDALNGSSEYDIEYRIQLEDGTTKMIRGQAEALKDEAGDLLALRGTNHDITERKRAEEAVRETSERLRLLLDSIPEGVYGIDTHGNCTFCNPACLRLLGYPEDTDLHGWDMHAVMHHSREDGTPYPVQDCQIRAAFRQGRGTHIDYEVLWRHDGTSFPAEYWSHPIHRHGQVIGAVVTFVNIAERKHAEQILREAREAAEAANQAKSQFLANMSHEIRTPMNGVIGMAGLLLDTQLTPEQRQYTEIVRSSGESLMVVINDILDFSKIEARKLALETIDFDLHTVLNFAAAVLAIKAAEKGLELTCEIEPGTPRLLRGDPGRVRQVLVNLLGNAVKFTAEGEVAVIVRLESENERSATLRFTIRDTGIGFRPEQTSSLFEPFVQADGSRTRKYGGTGLGLTISKQLVELMGGSIGAESAEGKGSTFWFTAVFEKQPGANVGLPEVLPSLRDARVMVVDDNGTNRLMVCRPLRSWGCRPEGFADGKSALAMFRGAAESADPFQVALIDVTLPVMDGEKLGRLMAAHPQSQPMAIVLMTAFGDGNDAACPQVAGFAGCVSKPILCDNLRDALLSLSAKGIGAVPAVKHVDLPAKPGRARTQLRILVAEDNPTNQQVALAMLKKLGHRTDVVWNGAEALDALRETDYDLVLMDCEMPRMDGYEAPRRVRNPQTGVRNPLIPIIAVTADAIAGDREKCLRAGMSDYLSKPVDPRRMADALEKWVNRREDDGVLTSEVDVLPANVKDVFNADRLLDRLMGDRSLAGQIVAGFVNDAPQQLLILKSKLDAGDAPGARMQAHTLKGAAATVSAEALCTICAEAQNVAAAGELTRVQALLPRMEEQFNLLKATLAQIGWL